MSEPHRLTVKVNDDLTLDAGWYEDIEENGKIWQHVHPPEVPMFRQVLIYLLDLPLPAPETIDLNIGIEAVATTAICLRWGSYLACLMDHNKPLWEEAADLTRRDTTSRISDGEMARINIEASAALEMLIQLRKIHDKTYSEVIWKARQHLPMTRWSISARGENDLLIRNVLLGLGQSDYAELYKKTVFTPEREAYLHQQIAEHPTRVMANAVINASYRNGPVEDIHAGVGSLYPLHQRRIILAEEREITRSTSTRLAGAIDALQWMKHEEPRREWVEQVAPYHLEPRLVTPPDWSLEETSRSFRLFASETEKV